LSVWFTIPSKRSFDEAGPLLKQWVERGYRVVIQRDPGDIAGFNAMTGITIVEHPYEGYPKAVNHLIRMVREQIATACGCPAPTWFVTGGDDTLPDPHYSAEQIARQCEEHFSKEIADPATFGVMQPTGDRFGERSDYHPFIARPNMLACVTCAGMEADDRHLKGAYIDRSAGSPWIGAEFARRMYGGRGPLCEEYWHMFDDTELQEVATMLGVFCQRRDLIHFHQHWGRPLPGETIARNAKPPKFLEHAAGPENWKRSKGIFEARKAADWPGWEPIP